MTRRAGSSTPSRDGRTSPRCRHLRRRRAAGHDPGAGATTAPAACACACTAPAPRPGPTSPPDHSAAAQQSRRRWRRQRRVAAHAGFRTPLSLVSEGGRGSFGDARHAARAPGARHRHRPAPPPARHASRARRARIRAEPSSSAAGTRLAEVTAAARRSRRVRRSASTTRRGRSRTKAAEVERSMYSGEVSSPRELQALQADVEQLRRHRRGLEDRELEVMERARALEPVVDELRARVRRARVRSGAPRRGIGRAEAEIDDELDRRAQPPATSSPPTARSRSPRGYERCRERGPRRRRGPPGRQHVPGLPPHDPGDRSGAHPQEPARHRRALRQLRLHPGAVSDTARDRSSSTATAARAGTRVRLRSAPSCSTRPPTRRPGSRP